jgi:AraC-like DNA-binding protein
MGESFSGYLKRRRLEKASALLTTTDKSVAEIASALGFSDQFSFSHFLKRVTGRSPLEFRADRGRRRPRHTNPQSSIGNR